MKHSIRSVLIIWLLIIALVPLLIFGVYSYKKTYESTFRMQSEMLEESGRLHRVLIEQRFSAALKNLKSWAHVSEYHDFLNTIHGSYHRSNSTLEQFVQSEDFQRYYRGNESLDLINLKKQYKYVYDLFLLDLEGNILYTVDRESDLGQNVFHGKISNTKFAQAIRQTLDDQKDHFSDIEHYAPSANKTSGFLTTPLLDPQGKMIGVMAVQFEISALLNFASSDRIKWYLVGNDGLLRSKIVSADEILKRKINTEVYWKWYDEHGLFDKRKIDMEETATRYIGPDDVRVIGQHHALNLLGIRWALITEIDESIAMAELKNLMQTIAFGALFVIIGVVLVAIIIASRITKPIKELSNTSLRYLQGEKGVRAEVRDDNEIGDFAEVFNQLMETLEENEARMALLLRQSKQSLDELREQKYALDAHAIVAITDLGGRIIFANDKFSQISGYSQEELIGKHHNIVNSHYHPSEFWKEMYDQIGRGEVWHNEVCNRAKDGKLYWVDTTIAPFMGEDGKPISYIAIRTDITHRKKIEEELTLAKESAEASVQAKSEFLATMSHEIRTPMNGVIGMLGLLERSSLDQIQRHQVQVATSSATSLLGLINDILDFSKIEAGKMEVEFIECNLTTLLNELHESLSFKTEEKGLSFTMDTHEITHPNIITDPGRLRQILVNLVGNAIKFTHRGGISITAHQSIAEETAHIAIDVRDSGIGIAPEKIDKLFDSFTQADGSTTRKYGGTGLGLAIVKRLSELLGGSINVQSNEGEGSLFRVTLTTRIGSEEPPMVSTPIIPSGKVLWPMNKRILLVEDNPTNQIVALGMLEALGLEADIAINGREAIDALRLSINLLPYSIVLMDCQMPVMDGYDATNAIRLGEAGEENKKVPIVAMTANAMSSDRDKCIVSGMDDYISKPIDLMILKSILLKYLGGEIIASQDVRQTNLLEETNEIKSRWDKEGAIKRLGGNEKLLHKIIESFVGDAPITIDSLAGALEKKNRADVQLYAHSLKGSSANVGITSLQELSKMMEHSAMDGDEKELEELLVQIKQAFESILPELQASINQTNEPLPSKRKKKLDPIDMGVKLQALRSNVENGFYVDMDEWKIEYTNEAFNISMRQLIQQIERFEHLEALQTIDYMMEILE